MWSERRFQHFWEEGALDNERPPVSYIELNMQNYDEDDVSQLNEWAIWATDRIEELQNELREKSKAIQNAYDDLKSHVA